MSERNATAPHLPENLWGYGKRLRFVDDAIMREFSGKERVELRLLDVGCGNGSQLAIPLAASGYQVTAVDPHLRSIQRARTLAPDVKFIHGIVTDLPPCHFDCVILSEVLEHLHAPELLLHAALGYLSNRGILIVTVPNGYGEFEMDRRCYEVLRAGTLVAWLNRILRRGNDPDVFAGSDDDSPHVQCFTLSRLRTMFQVNRLQVIEASGSSFVSGPFIAHLLGKSKSFVHINAAVIDYLPLTFAAGWMFSLRQTPITQP